MWALRRRLAARPSTTPLVGMWRWASDRSTLRVVDASTSVAVTLRVEPPRRYFDADPRGSAAGRRSRRGRNALCRRRSLERASCRSMRFERRREGDDRNRSHVRASRARRPRRSTTSRAARIRRQRHSSALTRMHSTCKLRPRVRASMVDEPSTPRMHVTSSDQSGESDDRVSTDGSAS